MQSGSLLEGGIVTGAPLDGGVIAEKESVMPVKNHVPVLEEVIAEIDRAINIDSVFSNSKAIPTLCVPESSATSLDLIEVVVMGEDTVTLNRGLMEKQFRGKKGFRGIRNWVYGWMW